MTAVVRNPKSYDLSAMAYASKNTFPPLSRSTLNDLLQDQHEKSSLVFVRVRAQPIETDIRGVCDESGRPRCLFYDVDGHKHT